MKYLFLIFFLFSWLYSNAQHQDKVDFIHSRIDINVEPVLKRINGRVRYKFLALENVDSVFLDAKKMTIRSVLLNEKKVRYENDSTRLIIRKKFKKGEEYSLKLEYEAHPKQTVYFLSEKDEILGNTQVWTQGQGKYTSHWLPSFDDMQEKVEFDLNIIIGDSDYEVIANGILKEKRKPLDSLNQWRFDMKQPMSSYLLAFAIGNYNKQELRSKSGIAIENYYYPKDSLKVESTYRHTKQIFDFLEEEIGFPYPWQNYKQLPVRDFLYAGMENTTATIFSDGYVIDSTAFIDKNYVNVNAHELAHQWFGNLVTEKSGNHHWLHEGFATYYAQLAEKEIFGDDQYYWTLYNSLSELQNTIDRGEGQSLMDPKASSLIFYEKGAWALYMLRNHIGDASFKKGIASYLESYKFKNVTISDFLSEMETASGKDLTHFKTDWLANTAIPLAAAKKQLQKDSKSVALLFAMEEDLEKTQSDDIDYEAYWEQTNSIHLKKHILETYYRVLPETIYQKAFDSDTIPIRQVMTRKMDSIPPVFKSKFESLLHDKSYVTIESALYKLWISYPEEKAKYLRQTKDVIGLPSKNVRLLWLTLAILTNDYDARNTQTYFKELSGYTSKEYGWEIRMGAFQYLNQAIGLDNESLKSLVSASTHHSWQFKKFARNLIAELLKDTDYQVRLKAITKGLTGEELHYMNTKLNKE